jgi:hypothetical protein
MFIKFLLNGCYVYYLENKVYQAKVTVLILIRRDPWVIQ